MSPSVKSPGTSSLSSTSQRLQTAEVLPPLVALGQELQQTGFETGHSTLEGTGPQHSRRSCLLLLRFRVGRLVKALDHRRSDPSGLTASSSIRVG